MSKPIIRIAPSVKRSFCRNLARKLCCVGLVPVQNMPRTVTSVERYLIVWYFYRNAPHLRYFYF